MSRLVLTLTLVVLFSVCLSAAFAAAAAPYGGWQNSAVAEMPTSSYLGPTGLLITPTAMIAPPLEGAVFYHSLESSPRRQAFYGVTLGLPEGFEVSAAQEVNVEAPPSEPGQFESETVLNAKYQVPLDKLITTTPYTPKVAVGLSDINNEVARVWYVALSDSFNVLENPKQPLNLHLGFANKDHGDGRLDGLFGGLDFNPTADSVLQAEYDGDSINADLRYYPARWVSLDLGVVADNFAWGATLNNEF